MSRMGNTIRPPAGGAQAVTWVALACFVLSACSAPAAGPTDAGDVAVAEAVVPDVVADLGPTPDTGQDLADLPRDTAPDLVDVADLADLADDLPPDLPADLPGDVTADEVGFQDLAPADIPPELPPPPCIEGEPCDDGDSCTFDDLCLDGECAGEAYACDDGRACTLDTCDGLGNCDYTLMVGKCLINGICAKAGEKKPGSLCAVCDPATDPFAWVEQPLAPCDDGDACTINDQCKDGTCSGETLLCDDNNPCTKDLCEPLLGCVFPPANVPCDDLDPCTALDFCQDGECQGGPAPPCDDENPCTEDWCQPGKGCLHKSLDGQPCDDNDACTLGDVCENNACVSGNEKPVCDDYNDCTADVCDTLVGCTFPLNGNPCCINDINICDDGDPCTVDSCNVDTGACIYLPNEGSCTDKNACTKDDLCIDGICQGEPVDCDDANPCTLDFCQEKIGCIHEEVNAACDDGSVCTLNDHCAAGQCVGTKLNCNDYNLCTDDVCDPVDGCVNTFNTAPCNDLDLCTGDDHCADGDCAGQPKNCDDSNPCTDDSCDPGTGCQNLFNQAACDDGDECTQGDSCQGGLCVPGELVCVSCDYAFADAVNRVTTMQIAKDAKPGNALDLDGDGQPDNSMAGIGGFANDPLQEALDKGDVHLLLEHHEILTDGNVYTLGLFVGDMAPGFENCDFSSQYCGYVVDSGALDPDTCQPMVLFDNASIYKGKLVAGGAAYVFPWQVPLSEETVLDITLYNAVIEADVTVKQGLVTGAQGIIAGAIPKQSFLEALDAVPAEQLPLPKDMIVQLIQALVVNDIDTDGNGAPDAASIAIGFEAVAGGILGTE